MYLLEQGPVEQQIIEQCQRDRTPLPPRIQNAPDLFLGLELYYFAFLDLTTTRGQGYSSEGPISWLDMQEYADRKELDEEQRDDLCYFIGRMDAAYLDHKGKKLEAKLKASEPPKSGRGKKK